MRNRCTVLGRSCARVAGAVDDIANNLSSLTVALSDSEVMGRWFVQPKLHWERDQVKETNHQDDLGSRAP